MSKIVHPFLTFGSTPAVSETKGKDIVKDEFYAFVIGGGPEPEGLKWSDISVYIPHAYKKENGRRIESKFYKPGQSDEQRYAIEPLLPELHAGEDSPSLGNTDVVVWKTLTEQYSQLQGVQKTAANAVKKWINSKNCAVWFHDANTDLCSQFGGKHLHVVVESDEIAPGMYRRPNNGGAVQTLKRHIKSVGGYFKSNAVRKPIELLNHFDCAPRMFLGSRSTVLRVLRYQSRTVTVPTAFASFAELCGGESDPDDDVQESLPPRDDNDNEDDVDGGKVSEKIARIFKRRFANLEVGNLFKATYESITEAHSDSGSTKGTDSADGGSSGKVMKGIKRPKLDEAPKLKDNVIDQHVEYIKKLMVENYCFDSEKFLRIASSLPDDAKQFILRMHRTKKLEDLIEAGKSELRVESHEKTFKDLAFECLSNPEFDRKEDYLSVKESVYWFFTWVSCLWSGQEYKFMKDLISVIDKTETKFNTFLIVGERDQGKSFFFQNPLQLLQPFKTIIGNVGSDSQFQWENTIGQRIVFIDECKLSQSNLETAKKVFGGEFTEVNRKHKRSAPFYRAPVICCGNTEPWHLALMQVDKDAMAARCHYYRSCSVEGVPKFGGLQLNPRLFYYIVDAWHQSTEDTFSLEFIYKFFPEIEYYAPDSDVEEEQPAIQEAQEEEVQEIDDLNE